MIQSVSDMNIIVFDYIHQKTIQQAMGNIVDKGISSFQIQTFENDYQDLGERNTKAVKVERVQRKVMGRSYSVQKQNKMKMVTVQQNGEDIMSTPWDWKEEKVLDEDFEMTNKAAVKHKQQDRFKNLEQNEHQHLVKKQEQNNLQISNNMQETALQHKQNQAEEDQSMLLSIIHLERQEPQNQQVLKLNRDRLQIQEKSNEFTGQILKDALAKAQTCDSLNNTIQDLHQIFQQFAVEQAVSVQRFKQIISRYRSNNNQLLSNKFLPLFQSIHKKIYIRIKKEISKHIETELARRQAKEKANGGKQQLMQSSEEDLTGKMIFERIDALMAEQRMRNQKQINLLKRRQDLQVELVKDVRSKYNKLNQKNNQLSQALVHQQKDYESLQKKTEGLQKRRQKLQPIFKRLLQMNHQRNIIESNKPKIDPQSKAHNNRQ